MKRNLVFLFSWLALFLTIAVDYDAGESYCVMFPQNGRDIFGVAQRNIVVFGEEEVALIPQVHFEGDARDFGILVPVPSQPTLAAAEATLFSEASFMTQPILRNSSSGCGCDNNDVITSPLFTRGGLESGSIVDDTAGGVTVISEQVVGMFQAAVLQATSPVDLTDWLNLNNYHFDPEDPEVLSSYIADNWFFVAMKFDSSQVPPWVDRWWNATTAPAKITFANSVNELSYPLKISAISSRERTEVLVYTISNEAMRFPQAKVEYANEIDGNEAEALAAQYPAFSAYISPGMFVTKLRRTFAKTEMTQDFKITTTDDRREFRDVRYVNRGW